MAATKATFAADSSKERFGFFFLKMSYPISHPIIHGEVFRTHVVYSPEIMPTISILEDGIIDAANLCRAFMLRVHSHNLVGGKALGDGSNQSYFFCPQFKL